MSAHESLLDELGYCPECGSPGDPSVMPAAYDEDCPPGAPCHFNAREEVSAMQNITVGRYDSGREEKGHSWAGWIEPEDKTWIMFVGEDPSNVQVYLNRDPVTGAVL